MKKLYIFLIISFFLGSLSFGASISSLFESDETDIEVTVQGEAIGDIMKRGDNTWINIKGDLSAIGIWASNNILKDVKIAGDYKHTGDWIEVDGIFHKQCLMHGGDTDIHAASIRVITPGSERNISAKPHEISFAILAFIAFSFIYVSRKVIQRKPIKIKE